MRVTLILPALILGATTARAQVSAAVADSLIRQALRAPRAPHVVLNDSAIRWDEGRYFNVAARSAGENEPGARLFACLVRLTPQPERPACIAVPLPGVDPEITADAMLVDWDFGDLDQDGEPEARFAYHYNGPLVGPVDIDSKPDSHKRAFVFDATPAPHFAFSEEVGLDAALRDLNTDWELTDVNGDGHADIVVSGEDCNRRTDTCRPYRRVFLWNRAADAWRPAPARTARR